MKDINDYIGLDIRNLHRTIYSFVLDEPTEGNTLLDGLMQTKRYEKEHEFRLIIDTAKLIAHNAHGEYEIVISKSRDVIERALSYKMWGELSLGYNLMGTAYLGLGIYEKALECYLTTIHNEKKHELSEMTSVAYNNMSLIYARINSHEKASEYMKLALETLEVGGITQPRYHTKKMHYLSNYIMNLCTLGRVMQAKPYLERLEGLMEEGGGQLATYSYYIAKMYHAFYTGDYESGKGAYFLAKESILEDGIKRFLALLIGYVRLCEKMELAPEFYIEELIVLEGEKEVHDSVHAHHFYDILRKYYKEMGNREAYDTITDYYISSIKHGRKMMEEQQATNLEIVEELVKINFEAENIFGRNTELKRMAGEAIKNRFALEKAYHKIEIINEIGRKITSTTDLHTVVEMIFKNLKQNIPLNIFAIMVPDEERKGLVTVVNYTFDRKLEEGFIPYDKEGSIFVDCFRSGKMVLSWDKDAEMKFANQYAAENRPSAIFLPLIVDNKTIGVCSVQYEGAKAYSEYHLQFLEDAAPYLSIALNNALRSRELEKEIRSHIETQEKLKALNRNLQKISAIDGLTQINQRRVFDEKILEILQEANYEKKPVSIIMIDIDDFKMFNDTYGHLEGDGVLKRVAAVFRDVMQVFNGISARFGGEEFIGAFTRFSVEESFMIADKIRQEIENLHIIHPSSCIGILTVSIGVAIAYEADVSMKSELMRIADESLYKAKNNGKNQVVITEI